MSNETKDKTAAETVAENMATGSGTAESVATGKTVTKGRKSGNGKRQPDGGDSTLKSVGKSACKRHGLKAVWVTSDGQCFAQENDARHHGKSLGLSAEPIKVEA